jgi:hypothetical protein
MRHTRGRHELQHTIQQPHPSAQDRREHQLLAGNRLARHARDRRFDLDVLQRQIARDLVTQQHADLAQQSAEGAGGCLLVAQDGELVLH